MEASEVIGGLREGERIVRLDPEPVLRTITYDVAERGLAMLGVDADDLFAGRDVKPEPPPLSKAEAFFGVVLQNDLKPRDMDPALLSAALEVVAASFFTDCLMIAAGRRRSARN